MKSLYDKIWESALRKLEIRLLSRREMEEKLSREFPQERGLILQVLEELTRVQLLNDRRFTEQYLTHLTQKAIGRLKIMVETRRKGLDSDLVEQILLDMGWSEEESAGRALQEKEARLSEKDPRKRKQKLMRFLQSRGFGDRVIFGGLKDN